MLNITIQTDVDKVIRQLGIAQRQIPFAAALALTKTAQQAQKDVSNALPEIFDKPNPFTRRGIGWERADKYTLRAKVFIKPKVAEYIRKQITGGTYLPKHRVLALPADAQRDQYGNVRRAWVKRMRARKDVFSGTVQGIPGLWQRQGKGVRLLLAYEPKAEYKPIFDFVGIVKASVARNLARNVGDAVRRAIATAR